MNHRHNFVHALLALSLVVVASMTVVLGQENATSALLEQLSHEQYAVREAAVEKLIAAGAKSIAPVEKLLPHENLEINLRCLSILSRIASENTDDTTRETAYLALTRIVRMEHAFLSSRAVTLLDVVRLERQSGAIKRLQQCGAIVFPEAGTLEITEDWHGTVKDLHGLMYLSDIRSVKLSGVQVTNAWLERIAQLPNLIELTVRKADITAQGITALQESTTLLSLSLYSVKVTDEIATPLKAMRQLRVLRVYNTQCTSELAGKFVETNPSLSVDVRRGGFLGIGGQPITPDPFSEANAPKGLFITMVQPESAAANAGVRVGDVLLTYGGKTMASFEELRSNVALAAPGDAVTLEIMRQGKREKLIFKLGEAE
jgi:PDZ domain